MPQTEIEPIDNYPELVAMGFKRNSSKTKFDEKIRRSNMEYTYLLFNGNELVYIGRSINRYRLSNHIICGKVFDAAYYKPTHFFSPLENTGRKKILETALIESYKTKYNNCWYAKRSHGRGGQQLN